MRNFIFKASFAAVVAMLFVACGDKFEEPKFHGGNISGDGVLSVSFEDAVSRTYIEDDGSVCWHADDRVSVFYGDNTLRQYRFDGNTGDSSGNICPVGGFQIGDNLTFDAVYALYPHSDNVSLSNGKFAVTMPSEQSYAENTFARGANVMVAVTENLSSTSLSFCNVTGAVKLQLWGDFTVKRITLTGNNNEVLAGNATVAAAYGNKPTLSFVGDGTKSVSLVCDNVKLNNASSSPKSFWIALPPVTFTKGFTIEIEDEKGRVVTKKTEKEIVIRSSSVQPMAAFEVVAVSKPANNEIWYTTSDGKALENLSNDRFGVTIKSHEKSGDKWVITFESDLTMLGKNGAMSGAFEGQNTLTSVVLPDSITKIGLWAFYNCSALQSVVLPANLQYISGQSFSGTALTSVSIPASVTYIESKAFQDSSLVSVNVFATTPPSLVNKDAFPNTSVIVYVPEESISKYQRHNVWSWFEIKALPDELLGGNGSGGDDNQGGEPGDGGNTEEGGSGNGDNQGGEGSEGEQPGSDPVVPPTTGSEIWYTTTDGNPITLRTQCFDAAVALHEKCGDKWVISFTGTLTTIGVDGSSTGAFENSSNLNSITIPDSVTKMHAYTFYDCGNLESVELSNNLQLIGGMSFYKCTSLTEITLPASVKNIDGAAFYDCSNLTTVNSLATTPPTLGGDDVFAGCNENVKIYVPDSAIGAYLQNSMWKKYTITTLSGNVPDDALMYAPNDPNYTSTDYSANGTYKALQTATAGNGIDIVLMGDGYSDRQVANGRYEADMRKAMEAFFSKEPYTSFRHLFNVYMVTCVSKSEGYSDVYVYPKDETALNCYIKSDGISIIGDNHKVYDYAREIFGEDNDGPRTDESTLIVIMNSDAYAGVCYMRQPQYNTTENYGNGNALSYFSLCGDDALFANLLVHEAAGHGFGKLGDEYFSTGNGAITKYFYGEIKDFEQWGWFKNVDATMGDALTADTIKWKHFLDDSRYLGLVGIYEGAYSFAKNAYRATDNSIMRHVKDSDGKFNAPSREAIYYRIHKLAYGDSWVYNFEDFVEYDAINR